MECAVVYNCYGIEELKLLHNKTIANGGVAFGPYSSIVTFTGHLLDEFDTRSFFDQPHPGIDGTGLFRYGATCHPMPHTAAGMIKAF